MKFAKKASNRNRYKLGELLLESGIISPDVLSHGLMIAKRAAMPLGRVLVMSGHVSERDVECAVQAQTFVRDGSIDARLARELLRFAHCHNVSIEEAYRLNGISRNLGPLPRLGKLVLAAGVVDESGLKCALRHSRNTGYPLGAALVSLELISEDILVSCMNLQILLRDGKIKFLQAVRALKEAHGQGLSVETSLKSQGVVTQSGYKRPRMGEMLVEAGLMTYADSLILAELGAENDRTYGELLREYGLVADNVVEAVAQIQKMFEFPMFTKARALHLLKLVSSMNTSLEQVNAKFDILEQVVTLLRAAEVIDEQTMRDVANSIVEFEKSVPEEIVSRGIISSEQIALAQDCLSRIESGLISYEDALAVLSYTAESHEEEVAA